MKKIDTPEGLLRLLADTIPAWIAFLDRNLEYRYLNGQYSEWFGIEPSDYVGKTPLHLMGSRAFEAVRPLYERALAGERIIEDLRMGLSPRAPRARCGSPFSTYERRRCARLMQHGDRHHRGKEDA
ncbi:MAG: PAS domain-containing protein [Hyphomicrobiales bacterium]